jgi:hypothetical protein
MAATDESTPPLMATKTFLLILLNYFIQSAISWPVRRTLELKFSRGNHQGLF